MLWATQTGRRKRIEPATRHAERRVLGGVKETAGHVTVGTDGSSGLDPNATPNAMEFRSYRLEALATAVQADGPQYERARAATALGHELDTLSQDPTKNVGDVVRATLGDAGTKRLEDALLELVGYAWVNCVVMLASLRFPQVSTAMPLATVGPEHPKSSKTGRSSRESAP